MTNSSNRGSSSGRGSRGRPGGRSGRSAGSSSRSSSNSRMWSQPATPRQLTALKANENHDGKYYSKGRARQTISESVRDAGASKPSSGGGVTGRSPLVALASPVVGPLATSALEPAEVRAEIVDTPPAVPAHAITHPTPAAEGRYGFREFLALFSELQERHLKDLQAQYGVYAGDVLRGGIRAWTDFRIKTVNRWIGAHAAVVAILDEAPLGSIPDPAATAEGLFDAALPFDSEERHLRNVQAQYGVYAGDVLRGEIEAWLTTRIEIATTNVRELVRALNEQALSAPAAHPAALPAAPSQQASTNTPSREAGAPPKARRRRTAQAGKGRTYTGTVLSTNPHGAVVLLDSGEQGWLHVSHLRQLNGGAWAESVSDFLMVGQVLRVRSIGTTHRGQVELALADARASKPTQNDTTTATTESRDDMPPVGTEPRRGGRKWFGFGRNEKAET